MFELINDSYNNRAFVNGPDYMIYILEKFMSLGADPNVGLSAISMLIRFTKLKNIDLRRSIESLTNFFKNKLDQQR